MQLAIRLNTGRDHVIAGVVLAIILLALLYTENNIRTTFTAGID